MRKKRLIYLLILAVFVSACYIGRKSLYKIGYEYLGFLKHDLPALDLSFSESDFESILNDRKDALKNGLMDFDKSNFVNAQLEIKDSIYSIKARLKGDYLDHIKGDKWSYRIQSNSLINGITRFSIHHPMRRNNISEFLWGFICEKEGILKVDYELKLVSINGEDKGIYAFEEHFDRNFTKRRNLNGIIVRFDERAYWELSKSNADNAFHKGYDLAVPDSYDTKFLKANGYASIEDTITRRMAIWKQGDFPTEQLFNTNKLATYFALSDVCSGHHGINWHNLKFYCDTTTMLLEPIAFDGDLYGTNSHTILDEVELNIHSSNFKEQLFKSESFKNEYLKALNKYISTERVSLLVDDFAPTQKKLQNVLNWEFPYYTFNTEFIDDNLSMIRKSLKEEFLPQ